jgi:hypothetical protein
VRDIRGILEVVIGGDAQTAAQEDPIRLLNWVQPGSDPRAMKSITCMVNTGRYAGPAPHRNTSILDLLHIDATQLYVCRSAPF